MVTAAEHLLVVGHAFVVEPSVVEAVLLVADFAEAFVAGIGEAVEFAAVTGTDLVEASEAY